MTSFAKPRAVQAWSANVNGDDVPHLGGHHFDVLFIQEAGTPRQVKKLHSLYPDMEVHSPANGQYHLAIVLNPRIFQVIDKPSMVAVHPSGKQMAKSRKWEFQGAPYPVKRVPTPPRGFFTLYGYWFGQKSHPGYLRVGHRINIGPDQQVRSWLGRLYDDKLAEVVKKENERGFEGISGFDYNDPTPKKIPGLLWAANHGPDHISLTKGMDPDSHMMIGGVAGHSGRVHHRSIGLTVKPGWLGK